MKQASCSGYGKYTLYKVMKDLKDLSLLSLVTGMGKARLKSQLMDFINYDTVSIL